MKRLSAADKIVMTPEAKLLYEIREIVRHAAGAGEGEGDSVGADTGTGPIEDTDEPPDITDENEVPLDHLPDPTLLCRLRTGMMERLLIDANEAARLCSISTSVWRHWNTSGFIPMPVHLGHRTLWRVDELRRWVEAGCPNRSRWIEMQGGQ